MVSSAGAGSVGERLLVLHGRRQVLLTRQELPGLCSNHSPFHDYDQREILTGKVLELARFLELYLDALW